ncbi:MAG: O-antigen ligase family protein, partial [Patescibacteria group bacterium]
MMIFFAVLFWITLLLGQLGAIPLGRGVILYVQDIVLCLMIITAVVRYKLFVKIRELRLIRPIALFAGLGVLSLVVNANHYPIGVIGKGSLYLLRWMVYAGMYGVVIASPLPKKFWIWWLGSFGIALSAIGLVQFFVYPDLRNLWYLGWDPHYYRVFATLLDPNYVGILLVLTIFVWIYIWVNNKKLRIWFVPLFMIAGAALILTYSRSSYLALIGGTSVVIGFLKRWKIGLILILTFLVAIVYSPKPGGDTLSLDRYDSSVARIQNWGQTITRIRERPVFGYGFNVVPFLDKEAASALPGRSGAGIDSSILFVAATTGIVGLASYFWHIGNQLALTRSKDSA